MSGNQIRKIAIYGKAGIGKSTTSSNISAVASKMGRRVLQVGCDPKRDSIATLCGGLKPTILDQTRKAPNLSQKLVDEVIYPGFNGTLGCECGGPAPGTGCAGKGVDLALKLISSYKVYERNDIDFVIYDVLGDVVCGGFSMPMRSGYAREIYLVACGELLTLYNTNTILKAVAKLRRAGSDVGVGGIIDNMRGVPNERAIVEAFAATVGVPVIHHVPRSAVVQEAESMGRTVIDAFPDSDQAREYEQLATKILDNTEIYVPVPITLAEMKDIVHRHQGAAATV